MSNLLELAKGLLHLVPNSASERWMIDGGCHIGRFVQGAVKVFPQWRILAFEPDPESWTTALKSNGLLTQLELVNSALGASQNRVELFRGPHSSTNSLLPRPAESLKPYYPPEAVATGSTMVDVVTIDDECEKRDIREVDVLKLDLQGGELDALIGAKKLLGAQLVKVLIIEVVFIKKYQDQPLLWEIWGHLEQHGFSRTSEGRAISNAG